MTCTFLQNYLPAELQVISFLVLVSETSEESFSSFGGPHRGAYFRGFRGPSPRMGRGGDRWHDNATRGRPPVPLFGNVPRFERPGMFEGPQRFNGRPRFNGARGDRPTRFDGSPRFDGPGSNRFNVPRFEGRPRFDASPVFRRGGPVVRLEAPFRGGPAMGPRFQGPVPPLLSQGFPPWYDGDEMENEDEMESEDFVGTAGGIPPLFVVDHPPWSDSTKVEDEQNVHEESVDEPENVAVASVSENKSENKTSAAVPVMENSASSGSSAGAEKRVRKSRWSSVPLQSTEKHLSAQPQDSTTEATDSTVDTETSKTDAV